MKLGESQNRPLYKLTSSYSVILSCDFNAVPLETSVRLGHDIQDLASLVITMQMNFLRIAITL